MNSGSYKASVNRSYYAIFHCLRSVTALDEFDSSKHSGVIEYFNKEYVKKGVFDKSVSKILDASFRLREKADYEDFYIVSKESAEEHYIRSKKEISKMIKQADGVIEFKQYREQDYQAVCDFLIMLNEPDKRYINWNWARFEWMYEHPEFDKDSKEYIGLWWNHDRIVGAAIYDMYFGEAFCGVLPEYKELYRDILIYATKNLSDDDGVAIAIEDSDTEKIHIAKSLGFEKIDQTENIMTCLLQGHKDYVLEEGIRIVELDPGHESEQFAWLLWQGFDHGTDREEFEKNDDCIKQIRRHLNTELSLAAVNGQNEPVAYVCLWYDKETDYAYIEPVCTIPKYRGKGIAKALLFEAFNRVFEMGANTANVISDMDFYSKLGLKNNKHYTFYKTSK